MSRLIKHNSIGKKISWIRNNMIPGVCPYTPELTASLLETEVKQKCIHMMIQRLYIKDVISYSSIFDPKVRSKN